MELKLMTFNIRYENRGDWGRRAWKHRVVGMIGAIREESPDVLGIQEGLHGQVADLRASLPDYSFAGIGRDDGQRKGEYAGLFFRKDRFEKDEAASGTLWLSDTPGIAGSKSWGNEIPRIATWVKLTDRSSGKNLWVANVHLDHRSQSSREKGLKLLVEKLLTMNPIGEPIVVMGDFNATENNEVLRFLRGEKSSVPAVDGFGGFLETYGVFHKGRRSKGSVNFWKSNPDLNWKLDHILVSRDAKILDAKVLRHGESYLSDHFPVTARVRW